MMNANAAHKMPQEKWRAEEYRAAIAPLKRKSDGAISNLHLDELKSLYSLIVAERRQYLPFEAHLAMKTKVTIPDGADLYVDLSNDSMVGDDGKDLSESYRKMDLGENCCGENVGIKRDC